MIETRDHVKIARKCHPMPVRIIGSMGPRKYLADVTGPDGVGTFIFHTPLFGRAWAEECLMVVDHDTHARISRVA